MISNWVLSVRLSFLRMLLENLSRATVEEFTLKTEMLILMARKYYGQKTLLRTIDILLEGSYETARG